MFPRTVGIHLLILKEIPREGSGEEREREGEREKERGRKRENISVSPSNNDYIMQAKGGSCIAPQNRK